MAASTRMRRAMIVLSTVWAISVLLVALDLSRSYYGKSKAITVFFVFAVIPLIVGWGARWVLEVPRRSKTGTPAPARETERSSEAANSDTAENRRTLLMTEPGGKRLDPSTEAKLDRRYRGIQFCGWCLLVWAVLGVVFSGSATDYRSTGEVIGVFLGRSLLPFTVLCAGVASFRRLWSCGSLLLSIAAAITFAAAAWRSIP